MSVRILTIVIPAFLAALPVSGQQGRPGQNGGVAGYAYPAGGCRDSVFEVEVGGAALGGTRGVRVSGSGVSAEVLKHIKPLNNMVENKIRDVLKAEREKMAGNAGSLKGLRKGKGAKGGGFVRDEELIKQIGIREGFSEEEIGAFIEMANQKRDPRRQPNPQLVEKVILRVRIDANAAPGRRDFRLLGTNGLSNPLSFMVGSVAELSEAEPNNDLSGADAAKVVFPSVINGRILPGDVDHFAFDARKGMKLTVAVAARELTPYLADAVPGWFQAVATLYDEKGREVVSKSGFAHRPDPLINLVVPADGRYVLQIRDSISRGREDFVYRIMIGEIPCLTEQFPAGGQIGSRVPVRVSGWNLADFETVVDVGGSPGTRMIPLKPPIIGFMHFEAGPHPEFHETPGDESSSSPWELVFPCTINAVIQKPGDKDCYAFRLEKGQSVVAEVRARRLGSPLDSMLQVSGPDGKIIASNDDCDDPGSGLLTHHADSRAVFSASVEGVYQFSIWDTQGAGGRSHNYRLTVAPPLPGFEVRIVPSALNGRAGSNITATAHVLRRDGFTGDVDLSLVDGPQGFGLQGARIPSGKDSVQFSLRVPSDASGVVPLRIQGAAKVDGGGITRMAVPAEDRMQAFFYRHLVPAEELLACISPSPNQGKKQQFLAGLMERAGRACAAGLTLPAGGSATLKLPGFQRATADGRMTFYLASPPAGVSLTTRAAGEATELVFAADKAIVRPGELGNLIVEIHGQPQGGQFAPKAGKKGRMVKIATLPAIRCRVTASAENAGAKRPE